VKEELEKRTPELDRIQMGMMTQLDAGPVLRSEYDHNVNDLVISFTSFVSFLLLCVRVCLDSIFFFFNSFLYTPHQQLIIVAYSVLF